MLSTLDAIRVNDATFSWTSCAFSIDGQSNESIVAIDYEESLEVRIIPSNIQDQVPLGMSLGRYQVGMFPLRMLRDAAGPLKRYLAAKAAASGIPSGSYGQAVFDMGLQLSGFDAPDGFPSNTVFAQCRIVGESLAYEESVGALVTEFKVACLAIAQDQTQIFDGFATASTALPGADTVTIEGTQAPGKWTLMKGEKVYGWEIRKGAALSGATIVPTGDEPVECEFLVEIWTPQDYALFQIFRAAYLKKALVSVPGSPVGMAIGIDHPELKAIGATAFVPRGHPVLTNDGFGVWSCTVKFLQYTGGPKPALSKPDAAFSDAGVARPTAKTQSQLELQALLQQQQNLGNR